MDIIRVQNEDFDATELLRQLIGQRVDIGASASFIGYVREQNDGHGVQAMLLEHYPGMTERALREIAGQAHTRWDIINLAIVHRVGRLQLGEQIVCVAVTSAHRRAAFEACEFLMDYLKTRAPFWKREALADGEQRWVQSRTSDMAAATRWNNKNAPKT